MTDLNFRLLLKPSRHLTFVPVTRPIASTTATLFHHFEPFLPNNDDYRADIPIGA
jgi:hypothetical protein